MGNVSASVTERAGVAILVHVPGATTEKLAIGTACFNQETGSRYFEVPVKNQGDILTAATGTFELETEAGEHVFDRPVELGTVIPTLDTVSGRFTPGPSARELRGEDCPHSEGWQRGHT